MEKVFEIGKEPYSEYSSNKARYFSLTKGHEDAYFEGGGVTALSEAKNYARKHGFTTMHLIPIQHRQKERIYKL